MLDSDKVESLQREADKKGLSLSSLIRWKLMYNEVKIGSDKILESIDFDHSASMIVGSEVITVGNHKYLQIITKSAK